MKRAIIALLALAACGTPDVTPVPPAVGGGHRTKVNPDIVDFELPGPNLYFICDGRVGVYVTEGSNGDSGKSASPAVVVDHPRCKEGAP